MKLAKNRKALTAIAIVLALVIAASATFAWITSRAAKENVFENEGFANSGLVVVEPQEEFKFTIGLETPKEVSVLNTGESPMLARVAFEEFIKLLGDSGQIYYSATATTAAIAKTETGKDMVAVPFNTSNLTGWQTLAAAGISVATGVTIPTTVTIYKQTDGPMFKACVDNSATASGKQMVKFDGKLNAAGDELISATLEYGYYTEGEAKYSSWNNNENYKDAAWLLKKAAATSVTGKPALADIGKSVVNPDEVLLNYDQAAFTATPAQDEWFYNAADGYFYYIGVLGGGQSTPLLLKGVTLDGNADQGVWQKYEYVLVVCVEGLQATKAALLDTDTATGNAAGWKLSSGALLTALNDAIDAYAP